MVKSLLEPKKNSKRNGKKRKKKKKRESDYFNPSGPIPPMGLGGM